MKLLSWNVNGLRSVLGKGFADFVQEHRPDILCIQETKTPGQAVELDLPGYRAYWNHAERKGYSGTATFLRTEPLDVREGIGAAKHDNEGRVLTTEHPEFFVVNVYVPNSKRDLARLPYRCEEWDVDFLKYVRKLEKKKPVIFCGDLNVAHKEIDLTHPKTNVKNHGFTPEERRGFDNIVGAGFVDTFREFESAGGHYTWWSQMGNCRAKNVGWRIDYVVISGALRPHLKRAFILPEVMGSDHCPVGVELAIKMK
ncbi:MAG: exodeoxyribonuclease III [Bacteroidetes bacterium]|nr:exodeoxyribonuclease III [Bacteroidota bacterium]